MRLTTKGRFAVTAMIDLALRQEQGPVTLAGISQRQHISLSYLEQLFGKLRRHEIVESVRGPGGGYNLARRAEDVTVADIIIAVDEPLDATQCGGKGTCEGTKQHDGHCMTHELWSTRRRAGRAARPPHRGARGRTRPRRAARAEFRFQYGRFLERREASELRTQKPEQ
jgi:iron-sulfur cluster assembly transcription factor IscR